MKRIQKVKDKENAPQTGEPLQEEEGRNGDGNEDIDVKVHEERRERTVRGILHDLKV